jgi:hypothetical protein
MKNCTFEFETTALLDKFQILPVQDLDPEHLSLFGPPYKS